VTWATSVPILVFLGLSVLDLGPMYATERRQTDVRQKHRLMPPPIRGRGIIIVILTSCRQEAATIFPARVRCRCGPAPAHTRLTPGLRRPARFASSSCGCREYSRCTRQTSSDVRQCHCLMPPRGRGITICKRAAAMICLLPLQVDNIFVFIRHVAPVPPCWLFNTSATS